VVLFQRRHGDHREGYPMEPTAYEFTVVIERDEDGVFIALCPVLPGCHSAGDTKAEARELIEDAIRLHLDYMRERGEPFPQEVSTTRVRVSA
jgi:predicted RNase H-like HicB family nuclease